ncbi:hypothetical protein PU02_0696 [Bartonella ancashensis]|uniref:Uncharacterized protein n=1 Tax=Bartonella ancashensis TaxID=1318743 RepID=A0A0M5L132_9HYPH|nr:hypothetical protein PU02_0083 [Bartonella ancashensis]ALE03510.1 hypothetical protein PU02_0696 [Bartonella ancashensis]
MKKSLILSTVNFSQLKAERINSIMWSQIWICSNEKKKAFMQKI